jgi:hypothetical protein
MNSNPEDRMARHARNPKTQLQNRDVDKMQEK